MDYRPQDIERKWQTRWAQTRAFEVSEDASRPKFYCLEMFAYPSGHAHVGHVRNYMIGDIMARTMRMRGYNVLHPFGWDAFGLPAENAAIKHAVHPERWTLDNIAHMKGQLQRIGISYAWGRELATCLPDYYRWNQWLFTRMFTRVVGYHLLTRFLLDQTRPLGLPDELVGSMRHTVAGWQGDARSPRWVNRLETRMTTDGAWSAAP